MIRVIDAMMGSGKTTKVFEMMRSNPNNKYMYISMFLNEVGDGNTGEVGRIQKVLPELDFKMPKNIGEGKLKALKTLVDKGCNISSTHSLFGMFDTEIVEMLVKADYTLIIDEAVDCIGVYGDVNESDISAMQLSKMITICPENKQLLWNEEMYPKHDGKYGEVRELCSLGSLYLHSKKVLIWEYPPKLLRELNNVYIVSYLFGGSVMSCWMKMNEIPYEVMDNSLLGLRSESELKAIVKENLTVLKSGKLDKMYPDSAFGVNWYKEALKDEFLTIKTVLESCVKNTRAKVGQVFWTTFKSNKEKLSGKGYSKAVNGNLEPFLACNTKATNDYRDYSLCMYTINVNKKPEEVGYLSSKGVDFNKDLYALSEMIQFVWRGCIREGKPMKVLVLNKRMRRLLENWINE